jgi:hypothetical protein
MSKAARRIIAAAKKILRYAHYSKVKTPVFVLGCQRSGTTLVLNVAGRSPKVHSYHEGDGVILDVEYFRIISEDAVRKAIDKTPEPIILFKPLNDSQYVDRLLGMHENAKAIWLYRHYRDVVDSAIKLWGDAQRTIMHEVSKGVYTDPGSRAVGERVTPENLEMVKRFTAKGLSPGDGAALLWYLRNSIYFDLGLQTNPRVQLCKYEDLVRESGKRFEAIFKFIGAGYSPKYTADVHASSVKKESAVAFDHEIVRLCEGMVKRLDDARLSQSVPQPSGGTRTNAPSFS